MVRDLRRLADTRFDLVIVGAGFYGAIAAWDAALRGLSVALIDKDDFGGGTSFNNLKTLHGGLRSLQALNLRADAAVHPRAARAGARGAASGAAAALRRPDLSRARSARRTLMRVGAGDQRRRSRAIATTGLPIPACTCRAGASSSRDECLRLNPVIDPRGVTGGAVWHDYQMHNTDRMTLSFVLSAAEAGAVVANYVEATGVPARGRARHRRARRGSR